jgi:hypothetical protein
MNCRECGQELTKVSFTGGDCFICLNWECRLYRERQEVKRKMIAQHFRKPPKEYATWDRYLLHLADTSRNYHDLRDRGFPVKFCKRFQSNKQTKRIKAMRQRGLSVKYITKMLSGEA